MSKAEAAFNKMWEDLPEANMLLGPWSKLKFVCRPMIGISLRRTTMSKTDYVVPYKVGDIVVRRPGTLGATGRHLKCTAVFDQGPHMMATVEWGGYTETFTADTYVRADDRTNFRPNPWLLPSHDR